MATSKCSQCKGTSFETVLASVPVRGGSGQQAPVVFVQCAGCGCVAGTLDGVNAAAAVGQLAASLGKPLR